MKIKFLFFLGCFALSITSLAQTYNPEQLLDVKNPDNFKNKIEQVYTGKPIVKIGTQQKKNTGPRLKPTSKTELEKQDLPLNFIHNIKTPFGISKTAGNIDHTTDFYTKIQIVDKKNVAIQENIQIITTTPTIIQRNIPLNLNNKNPLKIHVLGFERNGKNLHYTIKQNKDEFNIQSSKEFPAGVHNIQFKYILKNAISETNNISNLFISTTGGKWNLPINRFRAIVLHPYSAINYQKDLLFGKNNISLPEGINISTDVKGNTIYTTTRPLPAYADVRVFESFDGKNLPTSFSDEFVEKYFHLLLSGITLVCLSFYLYISNNYFKKTANKRETILKKINSLPTSVLMYLSNKKFTLNTFSDLKRIQKTCSKSTLNTKILRVCFKIKFLGYLLNLILNGYAIIYIMFKYIITGSILFLIIMHPLILSFNKVNAILIGSLILTYLIELSVFYLKTIKPEYQKDIQDFKEKILNPYLCYGLKPKTILSFYKRYYKTAYLLDIQQELKELIEQQTKNVSLPTTKKRG